MHQLASGLCYYGPSLYQRVLLLFLLLTQFNLICFIFVLFPYEALGSLGAWHFTVSRRPAGSFALYTYSHLQQLQSYSSPLPSTSRLIKNDSKEISSRPVSAQNYSIIPQVVHLWSLKRIQKSCLSVWLSDQGHSMATYGHISFQTAMPMPHASGRSPRGGDRHGPDHTSSGAPVCAVIRVDFQHPNRGDGSSSSNRSPKASGKTVRLVYFRVKSRVKIIFGLCCKR